MDAEITDDSEVLETPETNTEVVETPEVEEETVELTKAEADELRKKAAERDDFEQKNKQLFERAKKNAAKPAAPSQDGISSLDAIALAKADIHDDDLDTVLRYAKFENKSVKDVLKDPMLKGILSTRTEERNTAAATSTRPSTRGVAKERPEDLLAKAERGETVDDVAALFQARLAQKFPKRK